jgi:anti-sigma28 factor (negative regulator of flagellin synthesis)
MLTGSLPIHGLKERRAIVQRQRSLDLVVVTRQTFLWAAKSEVAHGSVERKDGEALRDAQCSLTPTWKLNDRAGISNSELLCIRAEKVKKIARAIKEGSYRVSSNDLAQSLTYRMLNGY